MSFSFSCSAASLKPRVSRCSRQPLRPVIPAETVGRVRSDQWAIRRNVSRKSVHHFAGQYDLNGSSLQVGQAKNRHGVVNYTTDDHYVCAAPRCQYVSA